nr:hypothetical protein [Tanacetum cinerariifolium]
DKALMNKLVNDGIKLSKLEINTGFLNGLSKKWLNNIYETEKSKSLVSVTPLSTAFLTTSIVKDFQDSPDDEKDTRSSHQYLNDLEEDYQSRALLAKSKRFFKKGTQRFSSAKATDQTECHKCGKKGHFARDYWSKTSVPSYQSPFQPKLLDSSSPEPRRTKDFEAKYNKVKAKLALLSSSALAPSLSSGKNKGLIAKTYDWDEEEVSSDDNEVTEVKALMVLTDEERVFVGRESANNGSDHNSDNASIHNETPNNHQQPNIQPQIIITILNNNAKFPYLKKDEYETLEVDVRGYSTFSLSHSAFVSATSTNKKMSYGDSPTHSSTTTYSVPSNSKTGSYRIDLEEMDLKWQMAMLSVRVHKFEQKARRKIDFDKKEYARFNKQKVKEIGKKKEDSKALITVDTLVDWSNHNSGSDEVIAAKEFGMIVGCDSTDAIREGANKLYNQINGANSKEANTPGDAGEFSLMGVTSETKLDNHLVLTEKWRTSSKNLYRLIDSSMSVRTKVGLGFTDCISQKELGWDDSAFSVFTTTSEDLEGRPTFHRFAKTNSMKVVPPPLTGDYTSLSDHTNLDESQMSYGSKSLTSCDPKSVPNDSVSCDDSDKSSEDNTNDLCLYGTYLIKDYDFYEKQITNTTVGPTVRPQPIPTGTPKVKPVSTGKPKATPVPTGRPRGTPDPTGEPKATPVPTSKPKGTPVPTGKPTVHPVPTGKPTVHPVPTGKPKFTPVPTGRLHRPFPVATDKGCSPSVPSGWWSHTATPLPYLFNPTSLYFQPYTSYVPTMYYNHMQYGGDRWATAVKPLAGGSWKAYKKGLHWDNTFSAAEDEGIFDSGCSRSMTGNKDRLDDFQAIYGGKVTFGGGEGRITGKWKICTPTLDFENVYYVKELQQFNLFSISQICDKKNQVLFTDTKCLVLSKDFKLLDDSMVVLKVPRKHNLYTINLNDLCPRGVKAVLPGCILVPTGRVPVPAGSVLVPTGSITVTTDRIPVPAGDTTVPTDDFTVHSSNSTNLMFDGEPTTRFPCPSDLGNHNPSPGIFSSSSYDDEFDTDLNNVASSVEVSPVPTTRINTIHPQSLIIGDPTSIVQTRSMVKQNTTCDSAFISSIVDQQRDNYTDFQHCLFACFLSQVELRSVAQALEDPSWVDTMQEEMQQFKFQNVWVLVDFSPGKYAIGTKWILKNKRDTRGIVVRNKARIVAQGNRQEEGIDYDEVFAPIARIEAIRLFLAFASDMGFLVYQMDVKSAFLYGRIEEEVYVTQPKGTIDKNLFLKKNNRDIILVQVYVDNIVFGSTKKECCDEFEALMKGEFRMSAMGELTFFLGLQKFDLGYVRIATTPYGAPKPKSKSESDSPVNCVFKASSHSYYFQFGSSKKIFKYLKGQPKLGLWYPKETPLVLDAYSDSDYVGTNKDMKSTTGGCQFLGRRLISWQCKKQTIVATSSTEAEYVAAANCCGQDKHLTIFQQSSMAALKYKEEHNKVGYLLKPTGSDDYHQIIDFLSGSHIRESELGPPAILATIDKTPYTITEALVRSRLQLADDGGVVDLPILEIYSGMDNLGYVTEGKLTFFKNKFSPQW